MPKEPGVYLFLDTKGNVLYVGKAKNLKNRVSSYFLNKSALGEKTWMLVSQIVKIRVILVESELESLLLEANLIKKYTPKYNIRLTDGKSYLSIQVSAGDTFPAILFARKQDDPTSVYFGPFPSSAAIKSVLKTIRRIFPFQAVRNHPKKPCLYYHLHLCPCPSVFDSLQFRKEYRQTITHIIDFLDGKKKQVIKDLEKERNQASKLENFELAQILQKKIDAINYITSRLHRPFEYEMNPNLRVDLRHKELEELKGILSNYNVRINKLDRIECYDNSNIQGHNAVSSMVVFTAGEKDSSQYRKFKIKTVEKDKPNDFATMEEVLQRRMRHKEWPMPDLIIVDGGKGQVSAALKVLTQLMIQVPIIGLAKREETIVTSDFQEISLSKDSAALYLIQRLRDEAHRFAITYHRKLRSKSFI